MREIKASKTKKKQTKDLTIKKKKKPTDNSATFLYVGKKSEKNLKIKIKKKYTKQAAVPSCGLNFDLSSLQSKMTMTKAKQRKGKNNVYF